MERNESVDAAGLRTRQAVGLTGPATLLEATGLAKRFGATQALADGAVSVEPGEIVALMGENGSGKSTLVKILSGVLRPDQGTVRMGDQRLSLSSPKDALRAGIVTVFQEILVAPDLSVLDNLWLGLGTQVNTRKTVAARRERAATVLATLCPEPPALDTLVGELDLMRQQVCVLARALLREPRLLILDEATSTLEVVIRDRLFAELRRLCQSGAGVLFISHRMDEVLSLADRFVALRSGSTVGTLTGGEATADRLVRLISGEDVVTERKPAVRAPATGQVAITVREVRVQPGSRPIDRIFQRGEIVGLAGLEGHGQDEFLRTLAGLHAPESGEVLLGSTDSGVPIRSYRQAVRRGISYVPRDRKVEGIADVLSSLDNFGAPTLGRDTLLGIVRKGRTLMRYADNGGTVNLHAAPRTPVGRLSGGNQQKVIIARWLATNPSVLLLNDPTRGVDLKTKHELYDLFERLAGEGMTIVMLSTELAEHLVLMDRILVFHGGSCVRELSRDEATREALVSAYFGRASQTGAEK